MLTDLWIISQLLAQTCALVLLVGAAFYSTSLLRYWIASASDEQQLSLERRSYLVSSMVAFVLVFQAAALLMFIFTVNNHLPGIIKGTMCASGVLGSNPYGYPLLLVKACALFFYSAFLMLHHFDESEPAFPLTPFKYRLIFPSLLLLFADYALMWLYFGNLNPDRIATCCSVSFMSNVATTSDFISSGRALPVAGGIFGLSFAGLAALLMRRKNAGIQLLLGGLYVAAGGYLVKFFFSKYIYGLSSHYCLFDLFFPRYYSVGYLIFGAYFVLLNCILLNLIYHRIKDRLLQPHLLNTSCQLAGVALLLSFIVPVLYWLTWQGNL